jgi:hypothetical protein
MHRQDSVELLKKFRCVRFVFRIQHEGGRGNGFVKECCGIVISEVDVELINDSGKLFVLEGSGIGNVNRRRFSAEGGREEVVRD